MKILIIGHARHGKDTVAEMLNKHFGFTFESSSQAAARIFLYDLLKEKYGYKNFYECFEDRVNRRKEWHDAICEFNTPDPARLAKYILEDSEMYVGMRSNKEVEACLREGLFDLVIGVYDPRKPEEDPSSFDINLWQKSDIVISNSGTLQDLEDKVKKLQSLFILEII
jgi:hypothetical protein